MFKKGAIFMDEEINIMGHFLVPKHEILSEKETEKVFKDFNITSDQLPKILITDPCVKLIGAKVGDILKIERNSPTAGISIIYRRVVDVVK
jgi:DNA-directed RNA polymerase subunit H